MLRGAGHPPFRADHLGSLLRPPALRQAFRRRGAGEIDDQAYRAVQDRCIREAVAMQEAVGLKVVTDGEFRRGSYWGRFVERIDGFAIRPASFKFAPIAGTRLCSPRLMRSARSGARGRLPSMSSASCAR